jgi:hypothetical protein
MADDENEVLDLWQNQTTEGFRMTPGEIETKLRKLEEKMRQGVRNGYLVFAFLIISLSIWIIVDPDTLTRLGAAAVMLAIIFIGLQVYESRFRVPSASAIATSSIEHLKRELERQRDFHRGKRFWSRLSLIAPAGMLFFAGFARAHPELIHIIRLEIASFIVIVFATIPLNLRMAKKYQRQIDELDRQKESV